MRPRVAQDGGWPTVGFSTEFGQAGAGPELDSWRLNGLGRRSSRRDAEIVVVSYPWLR